MKQLELEKLFAVAQDAEVGLTGKGSKKGFTGQEGIAEKPNAKKFGTVGANAVMLGSTSKTTAGAKKGADNPISAPTVTIEGSTVAGDRPIPRGKAAGCYERISREMTKAVGEDPGTLRRQGQEVGAH